MPNQFELDQDTRPIVKGGAPLYKDTQTILQIAGRTVALVRGTIMAQVASSKKWVPWLNANLAGTTGTQTPKGILMNDDSVTAAALAAGDVTGAVILVGGSGVLLDSSLVVYDGGDDGAQTKCTADSVPTVPTNQALRGEDLLNRIGLFLDLTTPLEKAET